MSETQTKQINQALGSGTGSENLFDPEFNLNMLSGEDMQKIEDAISPYVGTRHDIPEVTQEITQLFDELIDAKKSKISQQIVITQLASSEGKKMLLKVAKLIESPIFIECLITQLEARKHKLEAKFKSYTPKETN